jgi:hypothetical protein
MSLQTGDAPTPPFLQGPISPCSPVNVEIRPAPSQHIFYYLSQNHLRENSQKGNFAHNGSQIGLLACPTGVASQILLTRTPTTGIPSMVPSKFQTLLCYLYYDIFSVDQLPTSLWWNICEWMTRTLGKTWALCRAWLRWFTSSKSTVFVLP